MAKMKPSGFDWIGDIPESWKMGRIQFCLKEINEKNIPVKTEQVLSLVKDKGVMLYEEKGNQGNKSKEDISQYKVAYPDTLIVNSMNILIGSVGISNYMGCVSPVYYVFKDTEVSDLRYINYIFNTREFQKELRKYANGILEIRLRVSSSGIFKRNIPLPNKFLQQKISDYLDEKCGEIDSLRADLEKEIETLKEYKKSIITEAVTKGLNKNVPMKDSGIEWIGSIPSAWGVRRINTLYTPRNTKVNDDDYPPLSVTMKGILPQLENVAKTDDHSNRKLVKKGDFVINSRSDRRGSCGISKYNGSVSLINTVLKPFQNISPSYYDWLFHTSLFADEFYKWGHGIVDDLWSTNWQNMRSIFVTYPSVKEQKQIADYLDRKCSKIDDIIEAKNKQIAVLNEYKKSLIYEYVTGKKEVPNNE